MTEKRFTQKEDDWEILDRNKHFAYAHSGYQAEKIIQELNELVETNRELYKENERLKQENIDLRKDLGEFEKSINIQGLIGENERLKQQFSEQGTQIDVLKDENIQLEVMISFVLILFIIYFAMGC